MGMANVRSSGDGDNDSSQYSDSPDSCLSHLTAVSGLFIFNQMVKYVTESLDAVFSALGDSTRRAILAQLTEGETRVTELAEPHHMSLPAISKHLRVLETAGLVTKQKSGRVVRCSLNADPLKDAADWVGHYRRFWDDQLGRLERYLDDVAPSAPNTPNKGKFDD